MMCKLWDLHQQLSLCADAKTYRWQSGSRSPKPQTCWWRAWDAPPTGPHLWQTVNSFIHCNNNNNNNNNNALIKIRVFHNKSHKNQLNVKDVAVDYFSNEVVCQWLHRGNKILLSYWWRKIIIQKKIRLSCWCEQRLTLMWHSETSVKWSQRSNSTRITSICNRNKDVRPSPWRFLNLIQGGSKEARKEARKEGRFSNINANIWYYFTFKLKNVTKASFDVV